MVVDIQLGVMCNLVAKYCQNFGGTAAIIMSGGTEGPFKMLQTICEVMLHCFLKYHNVDICGSLALPVTNIHLCCSAVWCSNGCAFKQH
jgi:hypothetical protein